MLELSLLLAQLLLPKQAQRVPVPPPQIASASPVGRIALKTYTLSLVGSVPVNGDNDGFADTDETISLVPTLINKTGIDLTGVIVVLSTGDPTIACVKTSQVTVPSVAAGATFSTPPFVFRVGDVSTVNRTDPNATLQATFHLAIRSDQFAATARPIAFILSLDLSASGGSGPSPWVEDFETGGTNLGKFTLQTLDAGKNSLAASGGMRCQYNNPQGPNSNSTGNTDCFLGFPTDPISGINDWHIHTSGTAHGGLGRAYTGTQSLHWGLHLGLDPEDDTTSLKQLDAVKTIAGINIPLASAHPELVFAHQVAMVDTTINGNTPHETYDRGVVQVSVLRTDGVETPWKTIQPYWDEYDEVGFELYYNCAFDPTDDGNTESDFFDPADPDRRFGPSSTCYPTPVFACQGSTDYHFGASPGRTCNADDAGLAGSIDVGTWVRPRFNLQEFAGRRIKLRFLATSLEVGSVPDWYTFFVGRDTPVDDGWYVDDVHVDTALGLPLTVLADTKTVTALPCGACSTISAALTAAPTTLDTPGQGVVLGAGASSVDVCLNGPLQFQFWSDVNGNGVAGDAGDVLLRDFDPDWKFVATPESSGRIAVLARCLSDPLCDAADGSDTASVLVTVNCPQGVSRTAFGQTIHVDKTALISPYPEPDPVVTVFWDGPSAVDVIKGWLIGTPQFPASDTLRSAGSFTGSVAAVLACDSPSISSVTENVTPGPGAGFYFLVRGQTSATCPCLKTRRGSWPWSNA